MTRFAELADKLERGETSLDDIDWDRELAVLGLRLVEQQREDVEQHRQHIQEQVALERGSPEVRNLIRLMLKYPAVVPLVNDTIYRYIEELSSGDSEPSAPESSAPEPSIAEGPV